MQTKLEAILTALQDDEESGEEAKEGPNDATVFTPSSKAEAVPARQKDVDEEWNSIIEGKSP